jgi:tetratricopeptide (TPR) repeat protein
MSSSAIASAVALHAQARAELAAGRIATAREAASGAVEMLLAAGGPSDPDVVSVRFTAADIEQAAGDSAAARTQAAAAVAATQAWTLDAPDLVSLHFEAELRLATLERELGDGDAAERRLLDVLEQAREAARAERFVVRLTTALGVTYTAAGRLDDAQRRYDEVYDLMQSSPDTTPDDLAGLFHDLAGLAHSRRDVASGILWAQRAIALRATLGDSAALNLARDHAGLAALQHLAGKLDDARESYARAERGTTEALGPDHHEVGVLLASRAALESDAGEPAAAVGLYERALTLLTPALAPDRGEIAAIRGHLRLLLQQPFT